MHLFRRFCRSIRLSHISTMFLSSDLHETYTGHVPLQTKRAKVVGLFKFIFASAPWPHAYLTDLFCFFVFGINVTHEVTMCRAPFCVQQVKGQGHSYRLQSSSHRLFEIFVVSILSLRAYMTGSLHRSYKNNTWGGNVPCVCNFQKLSYIHILTSAIGFWNCERNRLHRTCQFYEMCVAAFILEVLVGHGGNN